MTAGSRGVSRLHRGRPSQPWHAPRTVVGDYRGSDLCRLARRDRDWEWPARSRQRRDNHQDFRSRQRRRHSKRRAAISNRDGHGFADLPEGVFGCAAIHGAATPNPPTGEDRSNDRRPDREHPDAGTTRRSGEQLVSPRKRVHPDPRAAGPRSPQRRRLPFDRPGGFIVLNRLQWDFGASPSCRNLRVFGGTASPTSGT
jgi:hypothetical protein